MNTLNRLKSIQLPQGTRTSRQGIQTPYNRSVQLQPGMDDLVDIVAGLQKDVKRINEALTLKGAREYARKHGSNWSAHEEDITGPNGKPDGIKEVFVCDSKGNVKVINGYGLSKTSYPLRKLYRTMAPTKDERKQYSYGRFLEQLKEINNNRNENGEYQYTLDLTTVPHLQNHPRRIAEFANVRKPNTTIKPREFFKQYAFEPVYQGEKEALKEAFHPMEMAQIYNKALSKAYNQFIRDPVLVSRFDVDLNTATSSQINKITKTAEFKSSAAELLDGKIHDPAQQLPADIHGIIGETADKVMDARPNINSNARQEVAQNVDINDEELLL